MNNQELELRIKEILSLENFFDMIEAAVDFEKEYKQSGFYKKTKMPLLEVIKNSKMWYNESVVHYCTALLCDIWKKGARV